MQLNKLQLAAMTKVGKAMILADGKVQGKESEVGALGLQKFGLNNADFEDVLLLSDSLKEIDMISILSSMNYEQKKYVLGYLVSIMASDGEADESELKLLNLISDLADFPSVSLREAAEFWLRG